MFDRYLNILHVSCILTSSIVSLLEFKNNYILDKMINELLLINDFINNTLLAISFIVNNKTILLVNIQEKH